MGPRRRPQFLNKQRQCKVTVQVLETLLWTFVPIEPHPSVGGLAKAETQPTQISVIQVMHQKSPVISPRFTI